jgi:hypothetical protein
VELSDGLGKLGKAGVSLVSRTEAILDELISGRAELEAVRLAMNGGYPLTRRQSKFGQTAFSLAFPLVYYVRSLSQYCRRHGIRQVYFLSREGLFFKRLFDALDNTGVKTYYLCVSRIALFMLTMDDLDEQGVDRVLDLFEHHSHFQEVSLKQVLYVLKVDDEEALDIVRQLGFNAEERMSVAAHRAVFRSVLLDARIRDVFMRKRSAYQALFLRYLRRVDMLDADRVLLSDMGWSGSMQTYLEAALRQQGYRVILHGYYFGYDKTLDAQKNGHSQAAKTGYFLYDGTESCLQERQIINNLSLEMLASASHGTVISYRDCRGIVSPVFKHIPEEIWQHRLFLRPFQDLIVHYALHYNSRFEEIAGAYSDDDLYAFCRQLAHNLFYQPTQEFQQFLAFVFYDDFFGKDVRILLAPYLRPTYSMRVRFGLRSVFSQIARCIVPRSVLGWLVDDDLRQGLVS